MDEPFGSADVGEGQRARVRSVPRGLGAPVPTSRRNRFIYTPDKDFKGKDAYLFKICATKGALNGCSTVAFVAEVK